MQQTYDAIIVGAGIAGLTAAKHLDEYNLRTLVIESSDRVGGRVKTDEHEGFRLDRGFQVLLTAYPEAKKQLDYEALQLRNFQPGALCFNGKKKFRIRDTNRDTQGIFTMPFSPVGSFMDKVRIANLNARLQAKSVEQIFNTPETTTEQYLKSKHFSKKIIKRFFKPFFSGIFLEQGLETSSRMFEFVFKMFAEGNAAVPAQGMEEIPKQLKSNLKSTEFLFHTKASQVMENSVVLENGEIVKGQQVILAAPADRLMPQVQGQTEWRRTSCFYFSAEKSLLRQNLIALSYREKGLVNNMLVHSDVSKHYAPEGKALVCVNLREAPQESVEHTCDVIKAELRQAFGEAVDSMEFLKNYEIDEALPQIENMAYKPPFENSRITDGVYLAGDHMLNPSLNAAMASGENAAKALVLNHNARL